MSDKDKKRSGGIIVRLIKLVALLLLVGVLYGAYLASQAQNLDDVGGYGEENLVAGRNLYGEIREGVRAGEVIRISERDLNAYVQENIELKQSGTLAEKVSARDIWVRLEKEVMEVIIEREVWGYPHTLSAKFRFPDIAMGDGRTKPAMEWDSVSVGQLRLPQGYGLLMVDGFEKLAEALEAELEPAFREMGKISVEKGMLVLDPRPQRVME